MVQVKIFHNYGNESLQDSINNFLKVYKITPDRIVNITQSSASRGYAEDFESRETICIWYMEESK